MSVERKKQSVATVKELRIFNAIWTVIFLAIGLLPITGGKPVTVWPLAVSGAFLLSAVLAPKAVTPFYRVWIRFGGFIGRVNAKIILGIIFYLIITPAGLLLKLMRKDLLNKRLDGDATSYFEERSIQPGSMRNQF